MVLAGSLIFKRQEVEVFCNFESTLRTAKFSSVVMAINFTKKVRILSINIDISWAFGDAYSKRSDRYLATISPIFIIQVYDKITCGILG